jgi:hypothetical protein
MTGNRFGRQTGPPVEVVGIVRNCGHRAKAARLLTARGHRYHGEISCYPTATSVSSSCLEVNEDVVSLYDSRKHLDGYHRGKPGRLSIEKIES